MGTNVQSQLLIGEKRLSGEADRCNKGGLTILDTLRVGASRKKRQYTKKRGKSGSYSSSK